MWHGLIQQSQSGELAAAAKNNSVVVSTEFQNGGSHTVSTLNEVREEIVSPGNGF